MPAHDAADLQKKHAAYRAFAEATLGMMGRSPDFMNCTLLAFAEGAEVFARGGERFGGNMVRYYEFVRENDLFLTHALMSPQNDRSKASSAQVEEDLHLGLVSESEEGIVVQGARMIATLGPVADEVLIYNIPGIPPEDRRHALVFAVPIDAPGLRQICREPYDGGEKRAADHPLAANFEEPRFPDDLRRGAGPVGPRVRLQRRGDRQRDLSRHQPQVIHRAPDLGARPGQAGVRGRRRDGGRPRGQDGSLSPRPADARRVRRGDRDRPRLHHPGRKSITNRRWRGSIRAEIAPLFMARTYLARTYPRVIEILQTIGAGGLLAMPSTADLESPIGPKIERYYQGAEGMPGAERVALYKLAWDLCGEAFGMRQLQYERYYAADPVRNMAANYLNYERSTCDALVEKALALGRQD